MIIKSLDNNFVKDLIKLKTKQERDKKNLFLVEGIHLVEEAYKNKLLIKIIKLEEINTDFDVETTVVSKEVMQKISDLKTYTNIIGICKKKIEKEINYDKNILILNNIQDPGNLGAIIRSAKAFDIDDILIDNKTVDLYNQKVIRSTQGMLFDLNIIRINIEEYLKKLKEFNYKIYCADINGKILLKDIEKNKKHVIIMGNEGKGIDANIKKMCDESLKIKINSSCESLNVAIATSIILYELSR